MRTLIGDTASGLAEARPSEDLREVEGVERGDCSVLDLKWRRSTSEEQEDCLACFLSTGLGGDLVEVTA